MKRKFKWLAPLTAGVFAATIGLTAFTALTTETYAYQPLSSEVSNLSAIETNNVYGNSIILGTDHYTDVDMPYGFIDPEIITEEGVYFNGFLFKNLWNSLCFSGCTNRNKNITFGKKNWK